MNISTPKYGTVSLGRQGENLATKVVLDASELKTVPGHPVLVHQRSNDILPYPCEITEVGDTVEWLVTSADTQYAGKGKLELRWYGDGDELIKSTIYTTVTLKSLSEPTEPPAAWEGYIKRFEDSVTPSIGENGNWFIGETDTGVRAEVVGVDTVEIEPSGYDDSDGNGCGCTDGKDGVGITNITITEE